MGGSKSLYVRELRNSGNCSSCFRMKSTMSHSDWMLSVFPCNALTITERMGGSFHLLGSENKLQAVVLARPDIAVAVQDFQPCLAV